jgi:prepilin-type N-terminal cleavage/methylation domain-containing protein
VLLIARDISQKESGFTLMELVLTIGVIGVLSAMSFMNYKTFQDNARIARAKVELQQLSEIIFAAELATERDVSFITRSSWSSGPCETSGPDSDACYSGMRASWDRISAAAGIEISDKMMRDPWGGYYNLNENEADGAYDGGPGWCNVYEDYVQMWITDRFLMRLIIPFSEPQCTDLEQHSGFMIFGSP